MRSVNFSSLRVRLAMLIFVALVPVLGLTWYTYREERDLILSHVAEDVQRIAQFAAGSQEQLIEGTRQLLMGIAGLPELRVSSDQASCYSHLAGLLEEYPRYANLGVVRPDGELFCSAVPVTDGKRFGEQAWFRRSVESRGFAMGTSQESPSTGKATFNISYPVLDAGREVKAVLFAAVDLSEISRLSSHVLLPAGAEFFMVADTGAVLAYLPRPEQWVGKAAGGEPLIQTITGRGQGVAEIAGFDGLTRLYAFAPLCSSVNTGIYVAVGMPTSAAYSVASEILAHHFVGLAFVILLALCAVWFGSDWFILRRISALLGAAQQLSLGDMKARTGLPHGRGELDGLARAFDEMADALEKQASDLRAAEAKYRTLVEQMPVITYTAALDARRTPLYISPQVERTLGFSAEEWTADSSLWMRRIHPDDLGAVHGALAGWLRDPGEAGFCLEYRILSRDGRLVWVKDEAVAVRDASGHFRHLQGIMQDVTEQRQAEEKLVLHQEQLRSLASQLSLAEERERRRIATELHDRVGQTLAISKIRLGLLREAAPSADIADAIHEVRKGIEQAIQDTRSLIFKISSPILYELGFEAALEWLTEQVQKEHGIRSRYENDDAPKPLDDDIRVLLFQAVGELLTNTVKHARATFVKVSTRRTGDRIAVTVEDDGAGIDISRIGSGWGRNEGFGLFSIRERLHHLDGHLEIESRPGLGARFTLTAPLKTMESTASA